MNIRDFNSSLSTLLQFLNSLSASPELDRAQTALDQLSWAFRQANFDDVVSFHTKFGVGPTHETPHLPEQDVFEFRYKFFQEELKELREAYFEKDLVKYFDAHLDLAYITHGSAHLAALPWQLGWELVHQANMKKRRANDAGESQFATGRGHVLDVVKPEGWQPPEGRLRHLLEMKSQGLPDSVIKAMRYSRRGQ